MVSTPPLVHARIGRANLDAGAIFRRYTTGSPAPAVTAAARRASRARRTTWRCAASSRPRLGSHTVTLANPLPQQRTAADRTLRRPLTFDGRPIHCARRDVRNSQRRRFRFLWVTLHRRSPSLRSIAASWTFTIHRALVRADRSGECGRHRCGTSTAATANLT